MKKILFVGCVESSYRLLSELIKQKKNVVGVITRDNSKFNSDFCDITPLCRENGISYYCVHNINDEDSLNFAKASGADVCFCFGWSQLLKGDFINLFSDGVFGFHPAALPNNRGRHPLIWALVLGLEETAVSFFVINEGADEGDIVSQRKVNISYEDDARTLYDKIMDVAIGQEIELLEELEHDQLVHIPQNKDEGNSWRKRSKADGQIDWRMSSRAIYNLVRGLTKPYVGAHFVFNNTDYKIWKIQELGLSGMVNIEPGKVIALNADGTMDVKVYDGAVRLIDYDSPQVEEGDYLI